MKATVGRGFSVVSGTGGLPKVMLVAPDGARAEVYLHGAHVASWAPAAGLMAGEERLFMSRASSFKDGAPIRGGVPVAFPQFGTTGSLTLHGFVRLMTWELASAEVTRERTVATFRLCDSEESRRLWDHPFVTELAVSIGGRELAMTLAATNAGSAPYGFTAALHTYLAVADSSQAKVEGLAGVRYRDAAAGGVEGMEGQAPIAFAGEFNRIYFDAPREVRLVEPARSTVIRSAGFADAVVWNPGAARCATIPDLEPQDYRRFVCVEAVSVGAPVELAAGERWEGTQSVLAA